MVAATSSHDPDLVEQARSEGTISSQSITSHESTTSSSSEPNTSTTSVPIGKEGDLLQHILQELSLSFDSRSSTASAKEKNKGSDSKDSVGTNNEEEDPTKQAVTSEASSTEMEETEQDETEAEQEDTEESEQEETEQEKTEETTTANKEEAHGQDKKTEQVDTEKTNQDLVLVLTDDTDNATEPEVIVIGPPPFPRPPKNPNISNEPDVGQVKTNAARTTKVKKTSGFSFLPTFGSLWKCTNNTQLGNVSDLGSVQEVTEPSIEIPSDEEAAYKLLVDSSLSRTASAGSSNDAAVIVHDKSKVFAVDPSTLVNAKDQIVAEPTSPEVLKQNESKTKEASLSSVDERGSDGKRVSFPSLFTRNSSAGSSSSATKICPRSVALNHSMPVTSINSMEKAEVRAARSHENSSQEATDMPQLGNKKWSGLSENGKDLEQGHTMLTIVAKTTESVDDVSTCEAKTVEECLGGNPSDHNEENVDDAANGLESKPEEVAATNPDSCASAENSAGPQPVTMLKRKIQGWTGKKRKKQGRRPTQTNDSPTLVTIKPRRRRRKSKLLRSLAKYVKSRPTPLPVISEDPDQADDATEEQQQSTDGANEALEGDLSETVTSPSDTSSTAGDREPVQNDSEQEDGPVSKENKMVPPELDIVDSEDRLSTKSSAGLRDQTCTSQGGDSGKAEVTGDGETLKENESDGSISNAPKGRKTESEPMLTESMESTDSVAQPGKTESFCLQKQQSSQDEKDFDCGVDAEPQVNSESIRVSRELGRSNNADDTQAALEQSQAALEQSKEPRQEEGTELGAEFGTELTWEMHKDAVDTTAEGSSDPSPDQKGKWNGHIFKDFLKKSNSKRVNQEGNDEVSSYQNTKIEEEEDGFCITLKASSEANVQPSETTEGIQSQNYSRFSPSSAASRSTKQGKKAVHERIFDFLENKPTWVEMKSKSTKAVGVSESTSTPNEGLKAKDVHKEKRGRRSFNRSKSLLKNIGRVSHGNQESREACQSQDARPISSRDEAPRPDKEANLQGQCSGSNHFHFGGEYLSHGGDDGWRSMEEKIDASLKKAEALLGEDIHALLHPSASCVSVGSMGVNSMGASSVGADSLGAVSESSKGNWRWTSVERKIDDSLSKVERLANRLGVPQTRPMTSE